MDTLTYLHTHTHTHTHVQTDWDDVKSSVTPLGLVAPVPRGINTKMGKPIATTIVYGMI